MIMRMKTLFSFHIVASILLVSPLSTQGAESYVGEIRPLIKTHCLGCHSTKTKKGGLDLERFGTTDQIRADIEIWEMALEMIERNEMPPKGKKQFDPEQRRVFVTWIRNLLDQEARDRAGDPGPALVRRLNNAEYNYAIRDLTGVDLQTARQFPADGAAGEGFLNATDALAISPDQMSKYFDAAKDVAAHTVLLPDGFRFSSSKFRGKWTADVLDEIRRLYAKYTNQFGQIPYDRYLRATINHREALRTGRTSIAAVAAQQKLSPKYLQVLWDAMNHDQPSLFLDDFRARWRMRRSVEDATGLANEISQQQALLWHKRDPVGMHALDDRYVPPGISLTTQHNYKLAMPPPAKDGSITFYLAARSFGGPSAELKLIVNNAAFRAKGKPAVSLREVLEKSEKPNSDQTFLDVTRFDKDSFFMASDEQIAVKVNASLVAGRTLTVDVRVDPERLSETLVHFDARLAPSPPTVKRGVEWTDVASALERHFLIARADDAARGRIHKAANAFRNLFPARVCYPEVRVVDTVVTLERFHRGDAFLSRLLLTDDEHKRLEQHWNELHFVSQDALQVRASYATLIQGEMKGYTEVKNEIHRRAKLTKEALLRAESTHVNSLLDFASRAYRRPLAKNEEQKLRDLYESLRQAKLPHEEAFRSVLARVLISPNFLYRLEASPTGKKPQRVRDWELATRLSFFLWSSIPDEELRQLAEKGKLHHAEVLQQQVRRMLNAPRSRALAVEFGAQWLEVRNFDQFQGKNQELFPMFDSKLREALYEESILTFQESFRDDSSIWKLLDADHTFVNDALAAHYGLPGVNGSEFRRVDGVKQHGRGGILGLGSVLAKHSGASRTSPVLRGNWIAEVLLGEKLPRPPDNVPKLPETESTDGLSIRQLVEKHAKLPNCAVCHQRIDPLGFALEQYDTIGRRREKDLAGRPIDARAEIKDGKSFVGLEGLRRYLLTKRKDDFQRQFCRKLLGYALGRRVILSDRQLLDDMAVALHQNEGRVSAAILAIVRSKQFQFIRGSEFARAREK